MKPKNCLLPGLLLLLGLCLTNCSRTEIAPPEEILPPEPVEEPEFKDVNKSMEETIPSEAKENYHSYFRFQNASDFPVIFEIAFKVNPSTVTGVKIQPGEQGTTGIAMTAAPFIDPEYVLVEDLSAVETIELYFNVPPADQREEIVPGVPRFISPRLDTCAIYSFHEGLEYDSREATPKDPARWTFEKFTDHRVRWTYRITNEDHGVAVRQTLERWAKKDEENEEK